MKRQDFNFTLPADRIAQTPLPKRDQSKLMVIDRHTNSISHSHFFELKSWLREGDVLVLNTTKVIHARLLGKKTTGAQIECLLQHPISDSEWTALIKPSKRVKEGDTIDVFYLPSRSPSKKNTSMPLSTTK